MKLKKSPLNVREKNFIQGQKNVVKISFLNFSAKRLVLQ